MSLVLPAMEMCPASLWRMVSSRDGQPCVVKRASVRSRIADGGRRLRRSKCTVTGRARRWGLLSGIRPLHRRVAPGWPDTILGNLCRPEASLVCHKDDSGQPEGWQNNRGSQRGEALTPEVRVPDGVLQPAVGSHGGEDGDDSRCDRQPWSSRPDEGCEHDQWPMPEVEGVGPVSDCYEWLRAEGAAHWIVWLGAGDQE